MHLWNCFPPDILHSENALVCFISLKLALHKKMKLSQFPADLVTFTKQSLMENFTFCTVQIMEPKK